MNMDRMNILFVACEWKERSVKWFSGAELLLFFKGFYTDAYFLGERPPPGFLGPIICLISMLVLLLSSVYWFSFLAHEVY